MIKDITLGQYFPGNSPIHRMDPRVKILWAFFYIILLFFVPNLWGFLVFGIFTLGVICTAKLNLKFVFKGLKPLLFLLVFTSAINIFMTAGEPVFSIWKITATKEGIYLAIYMVLRLSFLVFGTSILTFTTSPLKLTDGIENLLMPFSKIGVPAHEIAMMMTIAMRFIPTILEETDKIMKAQAARGADFASGNLINRAKALIPLLIPLFISAFRRADELAIAMECRCYRGGEGRTRLKELRISKLDIYSVFYAIGLLAIIILL